MRRCRPTRWTRLSGLFRRVPSYHLLRFLRGRSGLPAGHHVQRVRRLRGEEVPGARRPADQAARQARLQPHRHGVTAAAAAGPLLSSHVSAADGRVFQ